MKWFESTIYSKSQQLTYNMGKIKFKTVFPTLILINNTKIYSTVLNYITL